MIQGQDAVIAAQGCLMEDRVRAYGTCHGKAFRLEFFYSRCDLVDLLPAEEAVLSAMRVEAGNSHGPLCDAQAPEGCKALPDAGFDVVFCDVIKHSPQRFVSGQEKDTQTVCLEHGQRIRGIGQGAEDLGVADEGDFRSVESFLVDRGCGDGIRLAIHGKLDTLLDVVKSRLPAHSLYNAVGELRLVDVVEVDQVQDTGAIIAVRGFFNDIDPEVRAHDADRFFHDLTVADGDHICCITDFFPGTRLCHGLGAYAGGITGRYCNHRFFLRHFCSSIIESVRKSPASCRRHRDDLSLLDNYLLFLIIHFS